MGNLAQKAGGVGWEGSLALAQSIIVAAGLPCAATGATPFIAHHHGLTNSAITINMHQKATPTQKRELDALACSTVAASGIGAALHRRRR